MSKSLATKNVAAILVATALVFGFTFAFATPAKADVLSDLQAQVQALLAQIAALQGSGSVSAGAGCHTFTQNLKVGQSGGEVKWVQQFLNGHGATVAVSGAGSAGNETSHFGPATKAAVIKFQNANAATVLTPVGLKAGTGYWGASSRAAANSICAGVAVTPPPPPPTPPGQPVPPPTTTGTPTPITGQVTVSAGVQSSGSIISGAAQIPVLQFIVANGTTQAVTINAMNFTKTGVLSDSNIANAYVAIGSNIIAQYTGLSNGIVQFTNSNIVIPAGTQVTFLLRVDISSGTSNGNSVGFALASPADIQVSSGAVGGTFPIQGGSFTTTTVTNPSLAAITSLAYQGVAGTVDAGTLGFRAAALSFTVQNSPVKLTGIKFTISGSLNWLQDLQNPVLRLDGQQVGTGIVTPDGKVYFDTSAAGPVMTTGSHQLEVYVDVLGTANRTMQWQLLRPFEWTLVDTQYNSNLSGGTPSGAATVTSVRAGNSTVSLASGTPTGNIPLGSSNFTIAKFTYHASGEPVKIKWLPFKITESGSVTAWSPVAGVDPDIRNIAIYADNGTQLGTTINTPSSCTYGTPEVTATTYICSFGSPTSNINYIVPANTTVTFSLRLDVQAGADITTIKGSLVSPTATAGFTGSNTEGQISFATATAPGGTIDGAILTVVNNPFTASQNTSLSNQSVVGGVNNTKIASFSIGASSAEGIRLTSIQLNTSSSTDSTSGTLKAQNVLVKIGNIVLNYSIPSVTASTNYSFSIPSGTTDISAGGNVVADVYADVLQSSTATSYVSPFSLTGAVGTGMLTNTNQILKTQSGTVITTAAPLAGQNLTIGASGAFTVNGVSNDPVLSQLVKGTNGAILAKFQLRETTNNEAIRIINLTITASSTNSSTTASPFTNLILVDSSGVPIPGAGPLTFNASTTAGITTVKFSPSNMLVPPNGTLVVGLKGDVSSDENFFRNNNATSWVFSIFANGDVTSVGNGSAISVAPTGAGSGTNSQAITAVAAKLALASFVKQPSVVINNSTDLKLGQVTFTTSGSAGSYATLKTLKVTISGPAVATSGTINPVVYLRNPGDVVIATTTVALSSTTPSAVATFTIATSTTDGRVFVGTDKTFVVSMDTNQFVTPSTGNQNPVVSLQIGAASALTDVTYATYLGDPNFAESINLDRLAPSTPLPKTVSVGYQ